MKNKWRQRGAGLGGTAFPQRGRFSHRYRYNVKSCRRWQKAISGILSQEKPKPLGILHSLGRIQTRHSTRHNTVLMLLEMQLLQKRFESRASSPKLSSDLSDDISLSQSRCKSHLPHLRLNWSGKTNANFHLRPRDMGSTRAKGPRKAESRVFSYSLLLARLSSSPCAH